jgi:hypothetical protein
MENCHKSLFFFFLGIFLFAGSVSVCALTPVEEQKAAANYDESLPQQEEEPVLEDVVAAAEAQSAQDVVPPVSESQLAATAVAPLMPAEPATAASVAPVAPAVSAPAAAASQPAGDVQPPPTVSQDAPRDMPETQVFTTSNPSGLVEVSGYKYPVFLFAPKDYKTDRTYPLVIIAPAEDAKAEQQIEYLTGLAQRKSIFLLAPYSLWPKQGDTPYRLDEWMLSVKNDAIERFPISKKRVYIVGKDLGAHYAAYLAVKYPKEFTAATLIGQAWDGPFYQLIDPHSDAADQVPFYVALKADSEARVKNQPWFDKLQQKGYPIHLVEYKNDEEANDLEFKKSAFDWMESMGQSWEVTVAQNQKTWKGKFKKGVKDFFAV